MSTERRALIAKRACTRCSTQKRRCDRAIPDCGLCTRYRNESCRFVLYNIANPDVYRLRQPCKYEVPLVSSSGPIPSPSPRPEIFLGSGPSTQSHLKDAIIQKLGPLTLEDILSAYDKAIEPWFPIISISRLRSRLSLTPDGAPLDVVLLCLTILLLTTTPHPSLEGGSDPSEFKLLYLYTKSCITSTEGLGVNSFLIVQSRILVTLFEIAHGFYPAAFISIGATVRAADALEIHPGENRSTSNPLDGEAKRQETIRTWFGILIIDR
jgi:Fungal Zn(2)-Cys(6) binuclear cluster domain